MQRRPRRLEEDRREDPDYISVKPDDPSFPALNRIAPDVVHVDLGRVTGAVELPEQQVARFPATPLIALTEVRRRYGERDAAVEVLRGVSLEIYAGEFVAIVGASGSGKSTLMNLLRCLDPFAVLKQRNYGIR